MAYFYDGDGWRRTKKGSRPKDIWGRFAKVYPGRSHPKKPKDFKLPPHERKKRRAAGAKKSRQKKQRKENRRKHRESAESIKRDRRSDGRFVGVVDYYDRIRYQWRLGKSAEAGNVQYAISELQTKTNNKKSIVWIYVVADYDNRLAYIPTRAYLTNDHDPEQMINEAKEMIEFYRLNVHYFLLTMELV